MRRIRGHASGPAEHVLEVVTPRTNAARLSSEHLFGTLAPRGECAPEPVSLEVVGDAEQRRFLERTTKALDLRRVADQLGAAYPQAMLRPFQSATSRARRVGHARRVGSGGQLPCHGCRDASCWPGWRIR
jgi:hypothetical protein